MAFRCALHQLLGVALLVLLIVRPSNSAGRSKANEAVKGGIASDSIFHPELIQRHKSWMEEYNRTYPNKTVKDERLKIFANNVNFIDSFNRERHTFSLKANKFADLTDKEFMEIFTNKELSRRVIYYHHPRFPHQPQPANRSSTPPPQNATLQVKLDWRDKGAVTGVKDQGHCGEHSRN